uniref:Paired-like n=1 Tax=Oikopleura dioica TaxID=34765 RepID=Q5EVG1_OIKDI|nr:paired-like [Oikopleura dioica]
MVNSIELSFGIDRILRWEEIKYAAAVPLITIPCLARQLIKSAEVSIQQQQHDETSPKQDFTRNLSRNRRTQFNSLQLNHLEEVFKTTKYPDRHLRVKLAQMMKLDAKSIQYWFQNRRIILRKSTQTSRF